MFFLSEVAASTISLLLTGPTSASLTGILFLFSASISASKVPNVSALTTTPTTSLEIRILATSSATFLLYSSIFEGSSTANMGEPANASSRFGADIFTPAAAAT